MPLVAAPDPRRSRCTCSTPTGLPALARDARTPRRAPGWRRWASGRARRGAVPAGARRRPAARRCSAGARAAARARDRFHLAAAAAKLPPGRYGLADGAAELDPGLEALGWLMADYRFERYRRARRRRRARLPARRRRGPARIVAGAAALTQDLINTPARDMGPEALEAAFVALAARHGAEVRVTRGEAELRAGNLPMIAAVGAAAVEPPRLLDLTWGREDAPKVTLVGKGVCFDTGGLDIKPSASMALMKKDMGGAATAMGLAAMIMGLGLDLRLRVLVPAVENAISGAAMRPGDILPSRKGLTVEVEQHRRRGAAGARPTRWRWPTRRRRSYLISLATLTGAARVALGPDVPAFFTDDEALAADLLRAAGAVADPLWRLPFWEPYEPLIEPGIADLDNAPSGGMAGAITAALFLRRFVDRQPALLPPRHLRLDARREARPPEGRRRSRRRAPCSPFWRSAIAARPRALRPPAAAGAPRPCGGAPARQGRGGALRRRHAAAGDGDAARPDADAGPGARSSRPSCCTASASPSTRRDPTGWPGGRRSATATSATSRPPASARRSRAGSGSRRSGRRSTRGRTVQGAHAGGAAVPGRGGGRRHHRRLRPAARRRARAAGAPGAGRGRLRRPGGAVHRRALPLGRAQRRAGIDCSALVQLALMAVGRRRAARLRHAGGAARRGRAAPTRRRAAATCVLERPRRHPARPRHADPRQRPPHGGGRRALRRRRPRASPPPAAARSSPAGGFPTDRRPAAVVSPRAGSRDQATGRSASPASRTRSAARDATAGSTRPRPAPRSASRSARREARAPPRRTPACRPGRRSPG